MNYNELIQLYFERSNALQGYWNLYVVVVGGLLAFSSLRKQPAAITTLVVSVLFCLFAYENHDAIQVATGQRLKTHEAEKVREAIEAGQTLFGESRVQEARVKIPDLPSSARWHFVGHLQKNKIRHALPLFEVIHSVDSLALAEEVNRIAEEEGLHPRV